MPELAVVHADIPTCRVDAIVSAASSAMRGGGGVDGAVHRAGGPRVLADCIARFPHPPDRTRSTAGEGPGP